MNQKRCVEQGKISEVIHIVTTWNEVTFQDGLCYKNTILTYNLADSELHLLCDSVRHLTNGRIKVFAAENYLDLYTVPHFLAFINFANLREGEIQDYVAWRTECAGQSIAMDGEIFVLRDPLTYIFSCDNPVRGLPKLVVNSDIFTNKDMLEQTLLRETKSLKV